MYDFKSCKTSILHFRFKFIYLRSHREIEVKYRIYVSQKPISYLHCREKKYLSQKRFLGTKQKILPFFFIKLDYILIQNTYFIMIKDILENICRYMFLHIKYFQQLSSQNAFDTML